MLDESNFKRIFNLPCVVLLEPKAIFFRIPKCASTSIHRGYLQKNYVTLNGRTNRKGFDEWRKAVTFDWFREAFKFTFVRNPYDRFVSLFVYFTTYKPKVGENLADRWDDCVPSFEQFIYGFRDICNARKDIELHAVPQVGFAYYEGTQFVDFIGRFERLDADFAYVTEKLGLKPEKLQHLMKSNEKHYSTFYTEETKRIVGTLYRSDISFFHYYFC